MTSVPAYFDVVIALGPNGEFGLNGTLPWGHISEDMKHFSALTKRPLGESKECPPNAVIMGKKTWKSIGCKSLPNRLNIVVSSELSKATGDTVWRGSECACSSLNSALIELSKLRSEKKVGRIFVIGGVGLIMEGLKHPWCEVLHLTWICPISIPNMKADVCLDISFEDFSMVEREEFLIVKNREGIEYRREYEQYWHNRALSHPETNFLHLLETVSDSKIRKATRTGVDTLSIWGAQLKFDLERFPLITSKRVFWTGVIEELLFFLTGKTQTKALEAKNVKIWAKDTSRETLDARGFTRYDEGEIGCSYPFQWRHAGAEYRPNEQLEIGQGGVDQIQQVIDNIKAVKVDSTRSEARRLIVSSWDPSKLKQMVLPPCHLLLQFGVEDGKLNCMFIMRSSDTPIGLPWNIAFYALLTYMISHLTDLQPGSLVVNISDAHIYVNCLDQVREQLKRPPREWPILEIVRPHKTIDEFIPDSFRLSQYFPHPAITMPLNT